MQYIVASFEGSFLKKAIFTGSLSECIVWVNKYVQHENFVQINEQDPFPGMLSWNTKKGVIIVSSVAEAEKALKFLRSIQMDYASIEELTKVGLISLKD